MIRRKKNLLYFTFCLLVLSNETKLLFFLGVQMNELVAKPLTLTQKQEMQLRIMEKDKLSKKLREKKNRNGQNGKWDR